MSAAPRLRVRRDGPAGKPWRATLETPPGEVLGDELVGYFATHDEAIRTGVTAARFVASGISWRPVGVPDLDDLLRGA